MSKGKMNLDQILAIAFSFLGGQLFVTASVTLGAESLFWLGACCDLAGVWIISQSWNEGKA